MIARTVSDGADVRTTSWVNFNNHMWLRADSFATRVGACSPVSSSRQSLAENTASIASEMWVLSSNNLASNSFFFAQEKISCFESVDQYCKNRACSEIPLIANIKRTERPYFFA